MSRLPIMTGREVIRVLERAEFRVARIRGSHHFLRHADGRTTMIPVHANETIGPGLFGKVLRDVDMTRDQFIALLH